MKKTATLDTVLQELSIEEKRIKEANWTAIKAQDEILKVIFPAFRMIIGYLKKETDMQGKVLVELTENVIDIEQNLAQLAEAVENIDSDGDDEELIDLIIKLTLVVSQCVQLIDLHKLEDEASVQVKNIALQVLQEVAESDIPLEEENDGGRTNTSS